MRSYIYILIISLLIASCDNTLYKPEPEAEEKPDQPKTKGKALSLGWDGVS